MRLAVAVLLFGTLLVSASALAQDNPKVQVFGGYSLLHADSGGISGSDVDAGFGAPSGTFSTKNNFSGWNGELQYNVSPWLGAVADVSGHYGTPVSAIAGTGLPAAPMAQSYFFLFGPVVQHSTGSLRPFVHALFGVNRLSSDAGAATNFYGFAPVTVTDTAFAMALGGGVDWKVSKAFAVRLGQADYIYTKHDPLSYSNSLYGADFPAITATHQNNLRFSAGLVFSF